MKRETKNIRRIGSVNINEFSRVDALQFIVNAIDNRHREVIAFCNAHLATIAYDDQVVADALKEMIILNDGIGISLASLALYGKSFEDNLNGTDLIPQILAEIKKPTDIFLIGSPPGIADLAAIEINKKYPMVNVVGVWHGFFSDKENEALIAQVQANNPSLILVGMGNPRQEIWSSLMVKHFNAVIICVGAYLDFSAKRVTRAPILVRKLKMEWAWRLFLEPRRLGRRYTLGALQLLRVIIFEYWAIRFKR